MSTVTIPTQTGLRAKLQYISQQFWAGEATADEKATREEALFGLAATYNEVMRAERAHRKAYKCEADWRCKCPVHAKLSSACSDMYRLIEYLDYKATDGHQGLTPEWWEARGFTLVVPGDDPVFDYVLRDGKIPLPKGIVERAARWWVDYLVANLPGDARPNAGTFAIFDPVIYDVIDWTDDLKQRLQSAFVDLPTAKFAQGEAPAALEPLVLDAGPWGHSILLSQALNAVGFGPPRLLHNVSMSITPGSISIEDKVWTPVSVI